jgi:hypothetical protein
MSPRSFLFVACLGVVAATLPGPLHAEDAREVKIVASAQDSQREAHIGPVQLDTYGGVVIRSARDLVARSGRPDAADDAAAQKAAAADLAKLLDVEAVDWATHMVLAVRGEPGTKADRVHFESLKVEGKVLTVAWKVKQRPPHAGTGTPLALILVERFDGEVKFTP